MLLTTREGVRWKVQKRQLVWSQDGLPEEGLHRWASRRRRLQTKESDAKGWSRVCSYGELVREWVKECAPEEEARPGPLQVETWSQGASEV